MYTDISMYMCIHVILRHDSWRGSMYTCMISLNRHVYIYKCEYIYVYIHIASPPSYVYIHMYICICKYSYCLSSSLAFASLSFFTLSLSLPNTYTREMCVCIYIYISLRNLLYFFSLLHFFSCDLTPPSFLARNAHQEFPWSQGSWSYPWKREYEFFVYKQSAHVQFTVGKARKDGARVNESQHMYGWVTVHTWISHGALCDMTCSYVPCQQTELRL